MLGFPFFAILASRLSFILVSSPRARLPIPTLRHLGRRERPRILLRGV